MASLLIQKQKAKGKQGQTKWQLAAELYPISTAAIPAADVTQKLSIPKEGQWGQVPGKAEKLSCKETKQSETKSGQKK